MSFQVGAFQTNYQQVVGADQLTQKPTGAGKKRRRWQAEKDGKVYEFDTVNEAQQFLQSVVQIEQSKPKKKRVFRLPDVEIFYDDIQVTNVVIEKKPVIEWFFGHDIRILERALEQMDEDDIEVLILGL